MIDVKTFKGAEIAPHLDAVAELRIAVFHDWPYLYAGDREYEKKYLATYADSPESLFVLAFDGDRVVGASTGIPLTDETAAFQHPFIDRGIALDDVFYFGESVLLKDYRGHGLGHRFFDEREGYARKLGRFALTAFCAVERDAATRSAPRVSAATMCSGTNAATRVRTTCSASLNGRRSATIWQAAIACAFGCDRSIKLEPDIAQSQFFSPLPLAGEGRVRARWFALAVTATAPHPTSAPSPAGGRRETRFLEGRTRNETHCRHRPILDR